MEPGAAAVIDKADIPALSYGRENLEQDLILQGMYQKTVFEAEAVIGEKFPVQQSRAYKAKGHGLGTKFYGRHESVKEGG